MEFLNSLSEVILALAAAGGVTVGGIAALAYKYAKNAVERVGSVDALNMVTPLLRDAAEDIAYGVLGSVDEYLADPSNIEDSYVFQVVQDRMFGVSTKIEKLTGVKLTQLVSEEQMDGIIRHAVSAAVHEFKAQR